MQQSVVLVLSPLMLRWVMLHHICLCRYSALPVKWALEQMGKIASGIRLPLTRFDARFHATLSATMRESGIL
jgi:4-hydroxy-tetrahydrodipicolinate synthase